MRICMDRGWFFSSPMSRLGLLGEIALHRPVQGVVVHRSMERAELAKTAYSGSESAFHPLSVFLSAPEPRQAQQSVASRGICRGVCSVPFLECALLPRVGPAGPNGYAWTVLRSVLDSEGSARAWSRRAGPSSWGKGFILQRGAAAALRRHRIQRPGARETVPAGHHVRGHHEQPVPPGDHHPVGPHQVAALPRTRDARGGAAGDSRAPAPQGRSVFGHGTALPNTSRVSNRAMIGAPGCRNEAFLKNQVSVAEEVIPMSQVLNRFPASNRRLVWKAFCATLGAKDSAVRRVSPYVQARIDYAQQDNPGTITHLLLRYAPEEDIADVKKLAARVINLNMAATHTSYALVPLTGIPGSETPAQWVGSDGSPGRGSSHGRCSTGNSSAPVLEFCGSLINAAQFEQRESVIEIRRTSSPTAFPRTAHFPAGPAPADLSTHPD
ncbi:unnamed protein product [Mycena citricolor]|uniref:Uncharacterized protein n=1 Tax=Mycena citricolor TaxID=2018698 RepID=A0AAD2H934_9AGAR|nr:unnamed protein product [Mycena citricolor]